MAGRSAIEWTELTWNPVTGCTKISPGCKHCYAERMAHRLRHMGKTRYENGFELRLHEDLVELPLRWKAPRTIFVNSMSDLFHEKVPLEFIQSVFRTMCEAQQHRFQVLTKRADRVAELASRLSWPTNIWMGVSVESQKYAPRIDLLRQVPASVRFLSLEPLLGPLNSLNLAGIEWVIVGGESGPEARPMKEAWVTDILQQCKAADVPFFFKQWGGTNKKRTGRVLNERTYDEMPKAQTDRWPVVESPKRF